MSKKNNPFENHANWLVQNDRHTKSNAESMIKSFGIKTKDVERFAKRIESMQSWAFDDGFNEGKTQKENEIKEVLGIRIEHP